MTTGEPPHSSQDGVWNGPPPSAAPSLRVIGLASIAAIIVLVIIILTVFHD